MGVSSISVEKIGETLIYTTKTDKEFILNGQIINLSDYVVIVENNKMFLNNNEDHVVSLSNSSPYIITSDFKGPIHKIKKKIIDEDLSILLLYLNEITLPKNTIKKILFT